MKNDEKSYFCIEYFKRDENKKKILQKKEHYLIHLENWNSINDIKTNGSFLKKIL
jgi:hypothetical protein